MRAIIPILILAAVSACAWPAEVDAQSRRLPGKSKAAAPKKAKTKSTKKHVASLMKIARDLRKSGQVDVAMEIEAQARRLVGGSKTGVGTWIRAKDNKWIAVDEKGRRVAGVTTPAPIPPKAAPRAVGVWKRRPPTAPRAPIAVPGKVETKWAKKAPPTTSDETFRWVRTRVVPRPKTQKTPKHPGFVTVPKAPTAGGWRPVQVNPLLTPKTTGHDYSVIPKDRAPDANDARIDVGRERFRYSPVPTARDESGRLVWRGLAKAPDVEVPTTKFYKTVVPSDQHLQRRVQALSREVRAMRRTLDKLSGQLEKDRRRRLIR
jgi:hypothetical protein